MIRRLLFLIFGMSLLVINPTPGQQPVAQPKKKDASYDPRLPVKSGKDEKVDDAPPVVVPSNVENPVGALLPISLVRNRLEAMRDGTKAYVPAEAIKVDGRRHLWLHPHTIIGPKNAERLIMVMKEPMGYTVVLEGPGFSWEAEDFDPGAVKWLPVKNLQVK